MSKNDEIEVKPFSDSFEFGDDWLNDLEEALDFDLPDFDATKSSGSAHAAVKSESGSPVSKSSSSEAMASVPSSEERASAESSEVVSSELHSSDSEEQPAVSPVEGLSEAEPVAIRSVTGCAGSSSAVVSTL